MRAKNINELIVYKLSMDFSMLIFKATLKFPTSEKYSLSDQLRRASRSVSANIAEGWGMRDYPKLFKKHLTYAMGSLEETKCWIDYSERCNYINEDESISFLRSSEEIGAKLYLLRKSI